MHTNGHHPAPTSTPTSTSTPAAAAAAVAHDLDRLIVAQYARAAMRSEIDRRTVWTWSALVPGATGRVVELDPYTGLTEAQDETVALYREVDPASALRWIRAPHDGGHVLQARPTAESAWVDTGHRVVPSVRSLHGSCTQDGPTGAVAPTPTVVLDHADLRLVVAGLRAELDAWIRWHGEYGHEADTICTSGCFGGRIAPACTDCIDTVHAIDRAPHDLFGDDPGHTDDVTDPAPARR
ncbi:hypothetical protein [Streptomyces sp. SID3343]|uniref:hypothetical protein n=1 Tax=Streptomyces sp. SID3343 TaxID=2690260 RepID=UPI00136C5B30|nr:hypothetical protein [Streptomyces sp. SID3343]MYW06042.1 hypothetical protein [Streptomyces sp. SID3343]